MATNGHQSYAYTALSHTVNPDPNVDPLHIFYRKASNEQEWTDISRGLVDKPNVRSILVHTGKPNIVFAGNRDGIYRSDDRGDHWEALNTPKHLVTALASHPENPDVIFAGFDYTVPNAPDNRIDIYRSDDAGESWRATNVERVRFPHITTYIPPTDKRVTQFAFDPSNLSDMYASIEVGGLLASRDGGESWDQMIDGPFITIRTLDLHAVGVPQGAPGNVFISSCLGMFRSRDRGHHWEHVFIKNMYTLVMDNAVFPYGGTYCRGMQMTPGDPNTIYASGNRGGGSMLPGSARQGATFHSRDSGETWDYMDIGEYPPCNISQISVDQRAPSHVYAASTRGHLYSSSDGGDTFNKSLLPIETMEEPHLYSVSLGSG